MGRGYLDVITRALVADVIAICRYASLGRERSDMDPTQRRLMLSDPGTPTTRGDNL